METGGRSVWDFASPLLLCLWDLSMLPQLWLPSGPHGHIPLPRPRGSNRFLLLLLLLMGGGGAGEGLNTLS